MNTRFFLTASILSASFLLPLSAAGEDAGAEKNAAAGAGGCSGDNLSCLVERFRLGVALGFEHYRAKYVTEAEAVGTDKIVRISDSQSYQPSLWLTTTYVFKDLRGYLPDQSKMPGGLGWYVGVRAVGADAKIFDALSVGLTWVSRRRALEQPASGTESLNIGIGPVWHKTKVLASGIEEGKALPAYYNEVKYEKKDEISWMVMISAGF